VTRSYLRHVIIKYDTLTIVKCAQKIAAVLGEIFVPEYTQVPANIPVTTNSHQVQIIKEQNVM
jgi:hypothetical protein